MKNNFYNYTKKICKYTVIALIVLTFLIPGCFIFQGCSIKIETPKEHGKTSENAATGDDIDTASGTDNDTNSVSITFEITCKSIEPDNGVIYSHVISVDKESTAFDVLSAICRDNDIAFSYKGTKESAYITSINNISELEHGMLSGWMYKVNGTKPDVGCGKYVISQGDHIEFYYVTNYSS